ncbi:uncharacterized protein LOC141901047 [Tubulanus polymorphus]|uniref:uncharacterized protein LOC141901047 n=1 Tax=Tubulanus polymorphus TaxID=672921 RepID=UPI003DA3B9E4
MAEKDWYKYKDNSCSAPVGKSCGHFTQVIWKDTTRVGCFNKVCDTSDPTRKANYVVCNYETPGNMPNQKPY